MFNRMMYRTLSTESEFETSARPTFQQRFSGLKLRRILSVILLVGILCLVGSIFVLFARRIGNRGKDTKYIYNPTPLVNTTCGFVEGQQEEGVNVFKVMTRTITKGDYNVGYIIIKVHSARSKEVC